MSRQVWFTFENQFMDNEDVELLMETMVRKLLINSWGESGSDMEHTTIIASTNALPQLHRYIKAKCEESDPRKMVVNFGCFDQPGWDYSTPPQERIKTPKQATLEQKKKLFPHIWAELKRKYPHTFK